LHLLCAARFDERKKPPGFGQVAFGISFVLSLFVSDFSHPNRKNACVEKHDGKHHKINVNGDGQLRYHE